MNLTNKSTTSPPALPLVIIAVMRATGTGKSTFINLMSGSELAVSGGLYSCTSEVEATAPFILKGHRVELFDTPGFDDTTKSDTEILRSIAVFLQTTYENDVKLADIIYMHRISDIRMGGIAVQNFQMFRKLCGDQSLKNVVIVTNFWKELSGPAFDENVKREELLRNDDNFFKLALEKEAKLLRNDNTLTGAGKIIAAIVENHPIELCIQVELVDEKKSILETAAGIEMNRELVDQARKHAEDIARIKEDMDTAIKERDEQTRQELQIAEDKHNAEMLRVQKEVEKLAASHAEEKRRMERELKQKMEDVRAC